MLPDELSLIDKDWICSYCKKEGRSLRSGSVSSPSQHLNKPVSTLNSQSSSASSLSGDQFAAIMAKLNEMSLDMSTIKSTQLAIQSDLSECKSVLKEHSEDLRRHESLLDEHSNSIIKHETDIKACTSKMRSLEESNEQLSVAIDNASTKISEIEIQPAEMLERLRRSHNILIRGIPEASPADDEASVSQVLDRVNPDANSQRTSISRIGVSTNNRPRILKVSFNNPLIVTRILKDRRVIASVRDWRKYSITDDKTPLQVKELNDLRAELKHRIDAGESNINIKYISGKPTITKISTSKSAKN